MGHSVQGETRGTRLPQISDESGPANSPPRSFGPKFQGRGPVRLSAWQICYHTVSQQNVVQYACRTPKNDLLNIAMSSA